MMRQPLKRCFFLSLFLIARVGQAAMIQVNAPIPESINDGLCSIAEAITAANTDRQVDGCSAGQGADTIQLEPIRYIVSTVENNTDGANGFPVIQTDISIQGQLIPSSGSFSRLIRTEIRRGVRHSSGPSSFTGDSAPALRLFRVAENGILNLKDLELRNGSADTPSSTNALGHRGGAILNTGSLSLQHVNISRNWSSDAGGGIYSTGQVNISTNSDLSFNGSGTEGGAIAGTGSIMIRESVLEHNVAESGGAINVFHAAQAPSQLFVVNSVLTQNSAMQGGSIVVDSATEFKLLQSTIYKNTASESAGGLSISDSELTISEQKQGVIGNSLIALNAPGDCQILAVSPLSMMGNWFGDPSCNLSGFGDPGILEDAFFSRTGSFFWNQSDEVISANSALIDAGNDLICADELIGDQDVLGADRLVDGNGLNGAQCDIGAFERQLAPEIPFDTTAMFPFIKKLTVNSQWQQTIIEQTLPDQFAQLVFSSPPTSQGNQQGVMRLRSIGGCCTQQLLSSISPAPPLTSGFEAHFQEYTYLDQLHVNESVSMLGARPGVARSVNGHTVAIGSFDLSGTRRWQTVHFPVLDGVPAVFLTAQTANGGQPVSVRVRNVTESSFEAALFEEEALMNSGHTTEQIAYLLIQNPSNRGVLQLPDQEVPYQLQQTELNHQWQSVFDVELMLQEEQSNDAELGHVKEIVDVIKIGEHVFAQQVSNRGADSTSIRLRR